MTLNRFAKFAWAVLAYNIFVVLWGTYVRATGSGAGCGDHWPLCNGVVIPREPQLSTLIEFTHRATSGGALLSAIILFVWAWRAYPAKHLVRRAATASLFFMFTEALLGAVIVLFRWVAHDDSLERGLSASAHLVNTFTLLACLTLTAWWASNHATLNLKWNARSNLFLLATLGFYILGVSGAIAALGDTLFPAASLSEGLALDFAATSHLFLRLRIFHPLIAISVGLYVIILTAYYGLPHLTTRPYAIALMCLITLQWIAGVINVVLLAPVWMQVVHLLITDSLWITFTIMTATLYGDATLPVAASTQPAPNLSSAL